MLSISRLAIDEPSVRWLAAPAVRIEDQYTRASGAMTMARMAERDDQLDDREAALANVRIVVGRTLASPASCAPDIDRNSRRPKAADAKFRGKFSVLRHTCNALTISNDPRLPRIGFRCVSRENTTRHMSRSVSQFRYGKGCEDPATRAPTMPQGRCKRPGASSRADTVVARAVCALRGAGTALLMNIFITVAVIVLVVVAVVAFVVAMKRRNAQQLEARRQEAREHVRDTRTSRGSRPTRRLQKRRSGPRCRARAPYRGAAGTGCVGTAKRGAGHAGTRGRDRPRPLAALPSRKVEGLRGGRTMSVVEHRDTYESPDVRSERTVASSRISIGPGQVIAFALG